MGIRVFIADDHAVFRDGLRLLLESEGDIEVVGTASDGREAVRLVKKILPDVVVMDIAMPDMNGIEAARQIRETCPSVRLVMLSVYSATEHITRSLEAGANGYVLKESAGQDVVKAIRAIQKGQRYLGRGISEKAVDEQLKRRRKTGRRSPLDDLSSREREILQLVVEGKTSADIARALYLSPKTIETYRSRLMQKLDIHDIPGLVKFAIQNGLTTLK